MDFGFLPVSISGVRRRAFNLRTMMRCDKEADLSDNSAWATLRAFRYLQENRHDRYGFYNSQSIMGMFSHELNEEAVDKN